MLIKEVGFDSNRSEVILVLERSDLNFSSSRIYELLLWLRPKEIYITGNFNFLPLKEIIEAWDLVKKFKYESAKNLVGFNKLVSTKVINTDSIISELANEGIIVEEFKRKTEIELIVSTSYDDTLISRIFTFSTSEIKKVIIISRDLNLYHYLCPDGFEDFDIKKYLPLDGNLPSKFSIETEIRVFINGHLYQII
jgi:hypothetical protein